MLDFKALRQTWIARLNENAALKALGIPFEDFPVVPVPELADGAARGFVAIDEERTGDRYGDTVEVDLHTIVVVAGAAQANNADVIDAVREAILAVLAADPCFGGLVGFSYYAGSSPFRDGAGNRLYNTRTYVVKLRATI